MDLESILIQLLYKEQDELEPEEIIDIQLGDTPINEKEDLKTVFIGVSKIINKIIKYLDTVEIDNIDMVEFDSKITLLLDNLRDIASMLEEGPQVIIDQQE